MDIYEKINPVIKVEPPGGLWALARTSIEPDAPLVLHLISRKYDQSKDEITLQSDVEISIDK